MMLGTSAPLYFSAKVFVHHEHTYRYLTISQPVFGATRNRSNLAQGLELSGATGVGKSRFNHFILVSMATFAIAESGAKTSYCSMISRIILKEASTYTMPRAGPRLHVRNFFRTTDEVPTKRAIPRELHLPTALLHKLHLRL